MARPKQCRLVATTPQVRYFTPCGVPIHPSEEITLCVEGLEAMRLHDLENLSMQEAAKVMQISRFTYARILQQAHSMVARALIDGRALRIEGGCYELSKSVSAPQRECESLAVLAISSAGPSVNDALDPRYGRAAGFIIAHFLKDEELPKLRYVNNADCQSLEEGAGLATTENLIACGVTVVVSGRVGPKALAALENANISVIEEVEKVSVGEVLRRYKDGAYTQATL